MLLAWTFKFVKFADVQTELLELQAEILSLYMFWLYVYMLFSTCRGSEKMARSVPANLSDLVQLRREFSQGRVVVIVGP